jgi:hypothetical protein
MQKSKNGGAVTSRFHGCINVVFLIHFSLESSHGHGRCLKVSPESVSNTGRTTHSVSGYDWSEHDSQASLYLSMHTTKETLHTAGTQKQGGFDCSLTPAMHGLPIPVASLPLFAIVLYSVVNIEVLSYSVTLLLVVCMFCMLYRLSLALTCAVPPPCSLSACLPQAPSLVLQHLHCMAQHSTALPLLPVSIQLQCPPLCHVHQTSPLVPTTGATAAANLKQMQPSSPFPLTHTQPF